MLCGRHSGNFIMVYADQRWIGDHGIGRFAQHILANLKYRPVPLLSNPASPLDSWRLARALNQLDRNDLFLSPGYNSPLFCSAPFIFTIHDLNHVDRQENSSPLKRLYYATILKRACCRAAKILTVSEFSRSQIVEWSGVSPEKVLNVRCGVDTVHLPGVAAHELPFPYLLCVSNRKKHKNEFRTVEAFARSHVPAELRLVFTGEPTAELTEWIDSLHVGGRVQFVGTVPEGQMPSLYCSAEALIFVSLYEGFGLPVLEAMACGTPVITSNTTALPEVAGDAALMVSPTCLDEIAAAIEQIIGNAALREQLRKKGMVQAARFPWSASAEKVHTALSSASNYSAKEVC